MKRYVAAWLVPLCVCWGLAADAGPCRAAEDERAADAEAAAPGTVPAKCGALLCIDEPFHDFGDVERRGGDLEHCFVIRNGGDAPLVVTRVLTSCSCLRAEFPKRPLAAGAEAAIRIVYEPRKSEPGTFHKVIQVYSNSASGRQVLTVQGRAVGR